MCVVSKVPLVEVYLEKLLDKCLKPAISSLTYRIKSTVDFLQEIRSFKFNDSCFIASVDIVALFDNVDCSAFLDRLPVILSEFEDTWRPTVPKFRDATIDQIVQMFELVLNNSVFKYNNRVLLQKYGVPMGSPQSLFLCRICTLVILRKVFCQFALCVLSLYCIDVMLMISFWCLI